VQAGLLRVWGAPVSRQTETLVQPDEKATCWFSSLPEEAESWVAGNAVTTVLPLGVVAAGARAASSPSTTVAANMPLMIE
jgi:hypothetical protein